MFQFLDNLPHAIIIIIFFVSELLKKKKLTQQPDNMDIFESKIRKMDNLKTIGDFIDLLIFYHLKKCIFKDYDSCQFIDSITQIYILFYPNSEMEEEDEEVLVDELETLWNPLVILHFFRIYSYIA